MLVDQAKRLSDPEVRNAIRLLQSKGVSVEEIKSAYRYYDQLKERASNRARYKEVGEEDWLNA